MTISHLNETIESEAAVAAMELRDPSTITRVLTVMLWASIALDAVGLGSGVLEFSLLKQMQAGTISRWDMTATAEASDLRQLVIGISQIALYVVTALVFARWIYVLNDNKRRFGASGLVYTPGWAIGWFFVPFAGLVLPYDAMKELWRVSADPLQWQNQRRGVILPLWWFLWLLSWGLDQVSLRLSLHANTLADLIDANIIIDAADIASIALSFAALWLVGAIAGMQQERIRELART